jgi:hypothetical protein
MFLKALTIALLGSITVFEHATATNVNGPLPRDAGNLQEYANLRASIIRQRSNQNRARQAGANATTTAVSNQAAASTCLDPAVIQTGSASTGQSGNIAPGQIESLTCVSHPISDEPC